MLEQLLIFTIIMLIAPVCTPILVTMIVAVTIQDLIYGKKEKNKDDV